LLNLLLPQGRPQNLCHPCIPKIIHEFYYNAKSSLARGPHRSDFEEIVPENAVAAVMVAVLDSFISVSNMDSFYLDMA